MNQISSLRSYKFNCFSNFCSKASPPRHLEQVAHPLVHQMMILRFDSNQRTGWGRKSKQRELLDCALAAETPKRRPRSDHTVSDDRRRLPHRQDTHTPSQTPIQARMHACSSSTRSTLTLVRPLSVHHSAYEIPRGGGGGHDNRSVKPSTHPPKTPPLLNALMSLIAFVVTCCMVQKSRREEKRLDREEGEG